MKKTFGVSFALVGLLAVIAVGATNIAKPEGGNIGSSPTRLAEGGNIGSSPARVAEGSNIGSRQTTLPGTRSASAQPDQRAREGHEADQRRNEPRDRSTKEMDAITTDPLGNGLIGGIVGAAVKGGSLIVGGIVGALRGEAISNGINKGTDALKAAQEKAAQEKAAQEALQKAAQEKAAQEKAAQKAAQEKAAQEKAAQEKAAQDAREIQKATQPRNERGASEPHEHDHHDLNDAPDRDRDRVSKIA